MLLYQFIIINQLILYCHFLSKTAVFAAIGTAIGVMCSHRAGSPDTWFSWHFIPINHKLYCDATSYHELQAYFPLEGTWRCAQAQKHNQNQF